MPYSNVGRKNRILSIPNMLIERSSLQEELSSLGNEVYVCSNCGMESTNPDILAKCSLCGRANTLVKIES